tara:strand:+ start:5817 stop:6593 length:777 start_codon:yes stop_codon:yes gene_type:complete
MKNHFLILFIFFFLSGFSQSTETKHFSVSLGTGIDVISFRDISSSPLAYSGFGFPLVFRLKFGSEKIIHQFDIRLISEKISNNYPLQSRANSNLLTWEKASFNYSFLHRIKNEKNYLGASLNSFIFYREYNFLDGQSYEFVSSLDVSYKGIIPITYKYKIESNISLPIFAYIHRKPSLTVDEAFLDDLYNDGNLLKYGKAKFLFASWLGLNISIKNNFKINQRISITAEIGLNYYTIQFPEKVTNINYPILCCINYRF